MKNFIIWVVAIMLISFGIGMTIVNNSGDINSRSIGVGDHKAYHLENISQIKIKTSSEGVTIRRIDDNAVGADISGQTFSKNSGIEIKMEQTGDILYISIYRQKALFFFANIGPLNINLPKTYNKALDIETVSGKIEGDNLSDIENLSLTSTSGKIDIKNISGKVTSSTVSGGINLGFKTLNSDVIARSTSGKIELSLPKDGSYSLDFGTVSGSFNNNTGNSFEKSGHRNYQGKISSGKYSVDINTTSGGLELNNN